MAYMNMREKLDYLSDVENAIKMVCEPFKKPVPVTTPSPVNKPKAMADIHFTNALSLLDRLDDIKPAKENDGNNHKLGKYVRKKAGILQEAAIELTQTEKPHHYKLNTRRMQSKWFQLSNMTFIANQIGDIIFRNKMQKPAFRLKKEKTFLEVA